MQYIYESELDLQRPARETVWETLASVGDGNAHLLRVRVRSGGEEVDLEGREVYLYALRGDGMCAVSRGGTRGSVAEALLPPEALEAEGAVLASLVVADPEGDRALTVARVRLLTVGHGREIVSVGDAVPGLTQVLMQLEGMREARVRAQGLSRELASLGELLREEERQRETREQAREERRAEAEAREADRERAEGTRESAEAARQAAEGARAEAEEARASQALAMIRSEADREASEGLRSAGESAREASEALRVAAEGARSSGEAERAAAEALRAAGEGARQASEAARESAEEARQAAEGARETAEEARQTAEGAREASEGIRQASEALREGAEEARQAAEAARETAEEARQASETLREAAEGTRQASEAAREAAEGTRQASEALRQGAEQARQAAEGARESAEEARQASETVRETSEGTRHSSETARETAEGARQAAEAARSAAEQERRERLEQVVLAEAARELSEQLRESGEQLRAQAESLRALAEQERALAESRRGLALAVLEDAEAEAADVIAATQEALERASLWADALALAVALPAGAAPEVEIGEEEGRRVLRFGIPAGPRGAPGPVPQLRMGEVTTGPAGSDASARFTGTPEAPVLELTLPRGDTGDTGSLSVNGRRPDASGSIRLGAADIPDLGEEVMGLLDAQAMSEETVEELLNELDG